MQDTYQAFSRDVHARSAIAAVVLGLEDAWAAGDGQTWASYFAEDADFTVWFGLYLRGREAIADVHQEIFDSFYKSTKLRLHVRDLRFLRPDVAVVHFDGRIMGTARQSPEQPKFVPVAIMTKEDGRWRVAVFHNTKDTVDEQLGNAGVRNLSTGVAGLPCDREA
jgi:uncharacterized protein (TIGR02246 family)